MNETSRGRFDTTPVQSVIYHDPRHTHKGSLRSHQDSFLIIHLTRDLKVCSEKMSLPYFAGYVIHDVEAFQNYIFLATTELATIKWRVSLEICHQNTSVTRYPDVLLSTVKALFLILRRKSDLKKYAVVRRGD